MKNENVRKQNHIEIALYTYNLNDKKKNKTKYRNNYYSTTKIPRMTNINQ